MRPADRLPVCVDTHAQREGDGWPELELLQWLPGETLFSLVSRHHRLWGHRLAERTAQLLFGHHRQGYQHDFPGGLTHLVQATKGRLGDVDAIGLDRTLMRYYRPFLTESREQAYVAAMSGPSVAHLKYRLGLLTSRFRAHHPLKACLSCIEADRAQTGWAWWHLDHQFPGVWICPRHGEYLREALIKSNGVERFHWVLPDAHHLGRAPALVALGDPVAACIARFSVLVAEVVDRRPIIRFDSSTLQHHYRSALAERGLLSTNGRIAITAAAVEFMRHVRPLRMVAELEALPGDVDQAKSQLERMLRPMRSGTHPLRHLVMIDWLIGQSSDLLSRLGGAAIAVGTTFSDMPEHVVDARMPLVRRLEVMSRVQKGEMSMRAAAGALNVDTQTAMAWAAKLGIEAVRRPKLLKDSVRPELLAALKRGISKAEVASRWGISVTTVTTLLRTVPGLRDKWREAKFYAARDSSRYRWKALLTQHRAMGLQFMRSKEPAVFAWLYRNDKAWLDQQVPARVPRRPAARVDWGSRDLELSMAVQRAAQVARSTWGDRLLRKWHLIQAVPELRPKLRRLDQLPLTRQAIEAATCRSSMDKGSDLSVAPKD